MPRVKKASKDMPKSKMATDRGTPSRKIHKNNSSEHH